MNAIVQAYFLAGEKIYKMVGQLSEKDLSMLDERIKRSQKKKKSTTNVSDPMIKTEPEPEVEPQEEEAVEIEEVPMEDPIPSPVQQPKPEIINR